MMGIKCFFKGHKDELTPNNTIEFIVAEGICRGKKIGMVIGHLNFCQRCGKVYIKKELHLKSRGTE